MPDGINIWSRGSSRLTSKYRRYLAEVERLALLDPDPDSGEGARLELLALLVEMYEQVRFAFATARSDRGSLRSGWNSRGCGRRTAPLSAEEPGSGRRGVVLLSANEWEGHLRIALDAKVSFSFAGPTLPRAGAREVLWLGAVNTAEQLTCPLSAALRTAPP